MPAFSCRLRFSSSIDFHLASADAEPRYTATNFFMDFSFQLNQVPAESCLILDDPLRIPRHFPQVGVGILEVAGVTAIERVLRRLHDNCARAAGLFHHR